MLWIIIYPIVRMILTLYTGETDSKYFIKGAKQGEVMEWKNELLKDAM